MTILLTGAGGLLGGAFRDTLAGQDVVCIGRDQLDVRDAAAIRSLVIAHRLEAVINCAAHTDLEQAERDPDACVAANAVLPSVLAWACRAADAPLVHISSTGCYGDWKDTPYTEEDEPRPTTTHHRAKLSGERAVRESGCEHLILRTGWLFGGDMQQPKNFVWRRILDARAQPRMTSDAVQRGNPTYAPDVAEQALALLRGGVRGLFNVTANGAASRFDYVSRIVAAAGLACVVEPGPAFRRLAAVSPNEVGANYRLGLMGLDRMPAWEVALDRYVHVLLRSAG